MLYYSVRIQIIEVIRFQWVSNVSMWFSITVKCYYERIHRYVVCEVCWPMCGDTNTHAHTCIYLFNQWAPSYDKSISASSADLPTISNSLNDYCFSIMFDYDKSRSISFDLSHTKTNDTFWNETKWNDLICA